MRYTALLRLARSHCSSMAVCGMVYLCMYILLFSKALEGSLTSSMVVLRLRNFPYWDFDPAAFHCPVRDGVDLQTSLQVQYLQ